MNIILEGIDASGKSTLAQKLINNYDFIDIVHSGKDEATGIDYFIESIENKDKCIFDRFHLSEEIFPIIYKRTPRLSFDEYEKINKCLINNDLYYIVFICSDMSIIEERLRERDELYYMKEMNAQNTLFSMYAETFKNTYNYSNFYIIDIAELNAYHNLDRWLDNNLK